jgi:hypothetical protein
MIRRNPKAGRSRAKLGLLSVALLAVAGSGTGAVLVASGGPAPHETPVAHIGHANGGTTVTSTSTTVPVAPARDANGGTTVTNTPTAAPVASPAPVTPSRPTAAAVDTKVASVQTVTPTTSAPVIVTTEPSGTTPTTIPAAEFTILTGSCAEDSGIFTVSGVLSNAPLGTVVELDVVDIGLSGTAPTDADGHFFWSGSGTCANGGYTLDASADAVGENISLTAEPSGEPQCTADELAWLQVPGNGTSDQGGWETPSGDCYE